MDQNMAAVQEALRRRQGLGDSGAGIPGGAPMANANRPSNPIAQQGQVPNQPSTAMPSANNPFAGGSAMLNSAAPQGGTNLEKALIKRMNMYPPV